MIFQSQHDLFTSLTFRDPETDELLTGMISEIIAADQCPPSWGIYYTVELPNGDQYSVEEITMYGSKK
jgi:hypothetical protein